MARRNLLILVAACFIATSFHISTLAAGEVVYGKAGTRDLKASVIYYGFFNPRDDLKKMRAEILGHFAENDRAIRVDNVREFQAKLKTLGGHHEIYIYPNTTHGFASRPGENPNYVEKAAKQAWERTLAFLKKYL